MLEQGKRNHSGVIRAHPQIWGSIDASLCHTTWQKNQIKTHVAELYTVIVTTAVFNISRRTTTQFQSDGIN